MSQNIKFGWLSPVTGNQWSDHESLVLYPRAPHPARGASVLRFVVDRRSLLRLRRARSHARRGMRLPGSLSSRTSPTALSRTQRPLSQPLPRPASSPRAPFYHASCRDTPFELPIRTETLLTCYQQTDEGEMREALEMQDNRYLMGPFEKAHICPRA
jgi:hypothetical protein